MMHDKGVRTTSGECDGVNIGLTTHFPCFKNREKLNLATTMTTWEEENKVRQGRSEQHTLTFLELIDNDSHKHENRQNGHDCCW